MPYVYAYELLSKKNLLSQHFWLQNHGQPGSVPTEPIRSTKLREYLYTSAEKKTWKDSEPGDHFAIQFSIPAPINSISFLSRFPPGIDGFCDRKLNGKMVSGLGILPSFSLRRGIVLLSEFSRVDKLHRS